VFVLVAALPGRAATLTVTSLADDATPGTLRTAIANAASGDTINFAVTGTITLSQGTLGISKSLNVNGPGAANLVISGANAYTVFAIDPYITVSISGVTIANGYNHYPGGWGGGIVTKGTLTVNAVTFSGNYAPNGGGIFSYSNNRGLTITNSTFSGNTADWGGAIWNNPNAATTVINSTFSGNSATHVGGAIDNMGGSLWISFSTFSGNSAPQGGAIATSTNYLNSPGSYTVKGTLLANSTSGGNCYYGMPTSVQSGGHNLSDDASCGAFFTATGDRNSTPAGLDPTGLQAAGFRL
jgi:predicted outer membrane repeat protein